jgi:RHS repeat-associated protein
LQTFEYNMGFGGCCGSSFVSRHVDARGCATEHDYDSNGNRTQTRHRQDGIIEDFEYNAFGQRTRHILPDNGCGWRQEDVYSYFSSGPSTGYPQQSIVDALGDALTTSYAYDSRGNVTQVTDPRGTTSQMQYNALDQVVRTTSGLVTLCNLLQVQYQQDTFYDANNNVVQFDVLNIDDQGVVVASNDKITASFDHDILNRRVRLTQEVDPFNDIVTEHEYDDNRNETLIRFGEAVNGNQPANVIAWLYDERDLPYQKIQGAGGSAPSTSQRDYDGNQNVVKEWRGLEGCPRVKTLVYDGYDRLLWVVDAMGNRTRHRYDPNGNLVRLRVLGELCDIPGDTNNIRMLQLDCQYDVMDRMIKRDTAHFDPATQALIGDGISSFVMAYSDRSQIVQVVDDLGHITAMKYDTLNRRKLLTDAKGNTTCWQYDGNSNVVMETRVEISDGGHGDEVFQISRIYDEVDRLVLAVDDLSNQVKMGYDSRHNLTSILDPRSNLTRYTVDGHNRVLAVERTMTDSGYGDGNVLGTVCRTVCYDSSGRAVCRVDGNSNVTSYVYDDLGRMTHQIFADGTSYTKVYDPHDNVIRTRDGIGTTVDQTFDKGNRLLSRAIQVSSPASDDTTFETFKYDGLSRLIEAIDDDSTVMRQYDSLSNCTVDCQNGKSFVAQYDGLRNQTSLTYPGGKLVNRTFDALQRPDAIDNGVFLAGYDYIGPGRVERRTTGPASMTSEFLYDEVRRMKSVEHRKGLVNFDERSFGWDESNNKILAADTRVGGPELTHAYEYDSHERLVRTLVTEMVGTSRDTNYVLDDVGNRVSVVDDGCAGLFTMDPVAPEPADDVMNQYTGTPCIGCICYDRNGNPTLWGSLPMSHDYKNRMVKSEDAAGLVTIYLYDALGRRIQKRTPAAAPPAETNYYYAGWQVCEERDAADTVMATYVYGYGPQEVVEMVRGGASYYYFADDQGNVRAVTDAAGTVVERYEYEDFGEPQVFDAAGNPKAASAIGNPYLYTGQRYDPETGFYECRTRYLSPRLGRFTTRDSIGIWGDETALGNGLTYAANNPATLIDPMGTAPMQAMVPPKFPGPFVVNFDVKDCSPVDRVVTSVVNAAYGASLGDNRVKLWNGWELSGYPTGDPSNITGLKSIFAKMLRKRFHNWFAGPNDAIGFMHRMTIMATMIRTWEIIKFGGLRLECESSCPGGYLAWVSAGMMDQSLHLCMGWWNQSDQRRGSILLHEVTHKFSNTTDHFYYSTQDDPTMLFKIEIGGIVLEDGPYPNTFETSFLVENADTYEGMYLKYFIR